MASVNFFAHLDQLPAQVADNQYGPLAKTATDPEDASNPSKYFRVCSLFSGSATAPKPNPEAYAVMSGDLYIFPTANSTAHPDNSSRVNLVLIPHNAEVAAGIPRVRYFIYRGILKSEFRDGTDVAAVSPDNNVVVKEVHAIDTATGTTDEATKFIASLDAMAATSDLEKIDDFVAGGSLSPFFVNQGDMIGRFDGDAGFKYGFEIVLDEPDHDMSLGEARQDDHIIDASSGTAAEIALKRLEILAYIDPAAWFGMFARNQFGKVNNNKSTAIGDDWQGSKLIDNLLSKFATKETVYLDIRDEDDLPLDFMDATTYGKIKTTVDGSKASGKTAAAYRDSSGWPIRILTGFSGVALKAKWRYYLLRLSLPKGGTSKTKPLLFNPYGIFLNDWPSFATETRFSYPGLDGDWTADIQVALVASDNGGNAIASAYVRVGYTQAQDKAYLDKQVPEFSPLYPEKASILGKLRLGRLPAADKVTRTVDGAAAKTFVMQDLAGGYGVFEKAGYLLRTGRAVDSAGEVYFGYRGARRILLGSNTKTENEAITCSSIMKSMSFSSLAKEPSFYLGLQEWSRYDKDRLDAHFHKRTLKGVVGAHVCKLSPSVNTVEVRINEPQAFRGFKEWSPADPLFSVAYEKLEGGSLNYIVNDATKFSDTGLYRKSLVLDSSAVTQLPDPADATVRRHFKANFKVRGLNWNASDSKFEWKEEALSLDFYSLDGRNYFTHAYAEKLRTLGGLPLWENKVVPSLSSDTVYSDATKFNQAVPIPGSPPTTKTFPAFLTDILNEVKGVDERLVLGELRDYLYERDMNFFSYELAFRCPFFTEDPNEDPYQNVTIKSVTKPNNPYLDYFYTPSQSTPPFDLPLAELKELLNWQYALSGAAALTTEADYAAIGTKLESSVPTALSVSANVNQDTKQRLIYDFEISAAKTDTWDFILAQIHPKGWFLYANRIRAASKKVALEPLTFSGLTTSTNGLDGWDQSRYDAVGVKRSTSFLNLKVLAFIAAAVNWENPLTTWNNGGKYPHLPMGRLKKSKQGPQEVFITKNTYDLAHLVEAGVISEADKTTMEAVALADFGHVAVPDGTYEINKVSTTLNGGYLYKKEDDAAFYINHYRVTNSYQSGITYGFGYDAGANSDYAKLLDYIDEDELTGLVETLVRASMGKKALNAMKYFYPFYENTWKSIELDYDITLAKTVPIMKSKYMLPAFKNNFRQRKYWKTAWVRNNTLYYETGALRTSTEVESAFFAGIAYNKGAGAVTLNTKATPAYYQNGRRAVHAFNTHDPRYLRRAVVKARMATAHLVGCSQMLDSPAGIKSYRL